MIRLDTLTLARLAGNTCEPSSSTAMLGDWRIHDFNATDNFLARAYMPSRGKFVVIAFRGSDNWKDFALTVFVGDDAQISSVEAHALLSARC